MRAPPSIRARRSATNTASASEPYPPPSASSVSSPMPIPRTTPCSRRSAFSPRSPSEALSETSAAIGAKNGCRWLITSPAISQATVAAAVACRSSQTSSISIGDRCVQARLSRLTITARTASIVASFGAEPPSGFGRGEVGNDCHDRWSQRGGEVPVGRVVTLAALHGVGGSVIGPRVAERLGVEFLDRAIPSSVAKRAGLSEVAVTDADEGPHSLWSDVFDALGRASPPTGASGQPEGLDLEDRRLHAEIERFLADASRDGGVVLGRGGAVVLASVPGALHVYLGGARDARIERVRELDGIDRETAARRVKVNDRARRDYV